jgi:hypothetical protein
MRKSEGNQSARRLETFMEAAASLMQQISHDEGEPGHCARQIMQSPSTWKAWEHEYRDSLTRCTRYRHRAWQSRSLRADSMIWVHRAAPFRYLRDSGVRGDARRRLMSNFHGHHSLSRALVAEHGNYLRSVCSAACTEHIGEEMLGDVLLAKSVQRYESLYMDYFGAYCAATVPEAGTRQANRVGLLPMLKQQVYELRKAILEYPLRREWLDREATLRTPAGDTLRMRQLKTDRELR